MNAALSKVTRDRGIYADGEAVIMLAFQASGRGSTPLRRMFFPKARSPCKDSRILTYEYNFFWLRENNSSWRGECDLNWGERRSYTTRNKITYKISDKENIIHRRKKETRTSHSVGALTTEERVE